MDFFRKVSSYSAIWVLALICLASFSLMLWSARTDSAIQDELAHIPAGYGYVHNLDYRLNPEHPPLVKALAELPVLFLKPAFPTQSDAWQNELNAQWDMGGAFLYGSGNDADAIVRTSRVMPMLLTLALIILIYVVARKLTGTGSPWWALVPAFLFALSPTVIAHGHYVTTDVGAALGILLSLFYFVRYAENPSRKNLLYAGLAFGVAQLVKFSTPLLIPLFVFLVLVLWIKDMARYWSQTANRLKTFCLAFCRSFGELILIFALGYVLVVYPVYLLFTAHYPIAKEVADTTTLLKTFAHGPTPAGKFCAGMRCFADLDIWMAGNPVLRPFAHYMLGVLMALQRVDGGNTIYYLGQVVKAGGWTYFPVLFLIKEPIPTLVIVLGALAAALWWMIKKTPVARKQRMLDYLNLHFAEFSCVSFIVLYWGYSMHALLNIGIRHMMPTIPLIYILAAVVWKKWTMRMRGMPLDSFATAATSMAKSAAQYLVILFLLIWLSLETLFAAPYFLSYFNEFAGGTGNGYRYVTDSNYDWGQDLLRLTAWIDAQNKHCTLIETSEPCGIDKIAVDYFGGGNPGYYLGSKEVNWWSSKGNPADQGIHWFAVSVNNLEGSIQPLGIDTTRNPQDEYRWLTGLRPPAPGFGNVPQPDYKAGTSIFIYKL